jgi:hypothetical protein
VKLIRYGDDGFERPACIDSQGRLRDLSKSGDTVKLGIEGLGEQSQTVTAA